MSHRPPRSLCSSFVVGTLLLSALTTLGFSPGARAQLEQQPTQFEDEPDDEQAQQPPRLTRAPELIEGQDPIYPEEARAAGRAGEVILRITIDATGQVTRVDVLTSAGRDLDLAAMGAATNFVFRPAEVNDKPAPVAIEYRTVFEVQEQIVEVPTEPEPVDEFLEGDDETPRGPRNLVGVVREAATKAPLEGVEVTVEGDDDVTVAHPLETTFTDEEGRFEFRGLPAGSWYLSFAYSGYDPHFVTERIRPKERTEMVVYMTPSEANTFETVIRERRAKKEVAKISLTREEVRRVPGTFGDPLRVIENLPGLARAPFGGGALIVRGASPSNTGVYFDGVEIPILYHFGGLTSVVNPEFLEDINFFPGGFGAYYGRATAGIVDVSSRRLNMRNFRGYAEVDLIDSGFFFGGPVKVGQLPTFTFAAAARRSYIDALIPLALDVIVGPEGQTIVAAPVYWDYQLKVETAPLPGQHFSLFAFGSDDDLKVVSRGTGVGEGVDLGVHSTWHRLVGRWESRLPGNIVHFTQPFVGVNLNDLSIESELGIGATLGASLWTWGVRDELRFRPSELFEFAVGADYQGDTFGVTFDVPLPLEIGSFPRVVTRIPEENQQFDSSGMFNAIGVYSEAQIQVLPGLRIIPGVRAELTLVSFAEDELPTGETVPAKTVQMYNLDPRITARFEIFPGTTLKGAFGIYRQAPQTELAPEAGNPNLLPERAFQYIGGIEQALTRDINLDVQLYYTDRDLLIQDTGEVVLKGNGAAEPIFYNNEGRGRTFGLEVLLRHEISKYFFGWIAYTLSQSEIDLSERRDSFVLTSFDQTHILTLVGQVNLPWDFTFGGRFRLVSGNPSSRPIGSLHDLDTTNYGQIATRFGTTRLPAFHQLDLRLDRKWVFEAFSMTTYLDLLNVYNQQNAEGYQNDFRYREREPIPSLPILPVIGASGEF